MAASPAGVDVIGVAVTGTSGTGGTAGRRACSSVHEIRKLTAAEIATTSRLCSNTWRRGEGARDGSSSTDDIGDSAGSVRGTRSPAVSRRPQKPARAGNLLLP